MTHLEIMKFRHACKIFDENKKVGKADFDAILQAGILAPSYMGLEHWDFLVVQNKALRERIREKSWDQQQIQIEENVLVDGHIVAAIADGELSDNNITINKLNRPYSHSGITTGFKFSGRKSGIAAGRSGKNATNNIISIKDCLINGDVSGFNAPNGEINATLFSIEYSKIKGNVILGRAKSIKNSTLSLSTSEILGTIEGGGADSTLSIQAAAIFAKDIKNFGRLNFILTDKSERNNEFLVLRNSETLDLRGVKITLKIDEYDRPSIRKDDHIVLINSRKPIIIDENTKLQTIDIGKQGYEFKLQARGSELLAIATASPYKEYRRRRLFWWRLLFR